MLTQHSSSTSADYAIAIASAQVDTGMLAAAAFKSVHESTGKGGRPCRD